MVIKAKYQGKCRHCGGQIAIGDEIEWSRETGARHTKCPERSQLNASFKMSGGSGYGCRGWQKGQTMVSSKQHRDQGWPEFVTVESVSERYVEEDGLSFGVGDESGYIYFANCRTATEKEVAVAQEKIAQQEKITNHTKRIHEIKNQITQTGERPEGTHTINGTRYHDTQNVYGGGDWFEITDTHIWYCRNNGSDGADWRVNNVETGGAGAIGWRIPYDSDIVGVIEK